MALRKITKKLDEGHACLTFTMSSSTQNENGDYVSVWNASRPVTAVGLNSHFPSSVFIDFETEAIDFRTSPETFYEWGYTQVLGSDDSYYMSFTETTSTLPSSGAKSVDFFFRPTVSARPKSAAAMRQYYQCDGVGQFGGNEFPENTNIETLYNEKYQSFAEGIPYMGVGQAGKLWANTFGGNASVYFKYQNYEEIYYKTLLLFNRRYVNTRDLPASTEMYYIQKITDKKKGDYYQIGSQATGEEVGRIPDDTSCLVALMQAGGGGGAGCVYPDLNLLSSFESGGGGGSGGNMCLIIYLNKFFHDNPSGIIWFRVGKGGSGGLHYKGTPWSSPPSTIMGSAGSQTHMFLSTKGNDNNPLAICHGGGGGGEHMTSPTEQYIPFRPGAGADVSEFNYTGEYISLLKKDGISSGKDFLNAGVAGGKGSSNTSESRTPLPGADYEASTISFIDDLAMAAQKGGECSGDGSVNAYAGGGGGASLLGKGGVQYSPPSMTSHDYPGFGAGGAGGTVRSKTVVGGITNGQDGGDGVVRLWWPSS